MTKVAVANARSVYSKALRRELINTSYFLGSLDFYPEHTGAGAEVETCVG